MSFTDDRLIRIAGKGDTFYTSAQSVCRMLVMQQPRAIKTWQKNFPRENCVISSNKQYPPSGMEVHKAPFQEKSSYFQQGSMHFSGRVAKLSLVQDCGASWRSNLFVKRVARVTKKTAILCPRRVQSASSSLHGGRQTRGLFWGTPFWLVFKGKQKGN